MARYDNFPSGPRAKLAKGLFVTRGPAHKTPKDVAKAKAEAGMVNGQYTAPMRKIGRV